MQHSIVFKCDVACVWQDSVPVLKPLVQSLYNYCIIIILENGNIETLIKWTPIGWWCYRMRKLRSKFSSFESRLTDFFPRSPNTKNEQGNKRPIFFKLWNKNIELSAWKLCLKNKANLRDLIAVIGLVILLKLDSNRRLINRCDLEIYWITSNNNKAPLPNII